MQTVELNSLLGATSKYTANNPRMLCINSGELSYRDLVTTLPSGTNINEVVASGCYKLQNSTTPMPYGVASLGCILNVLHWDANRVYHELISLKARHTRVKNGENWSDWEKVSTSTVLGGG